MPLTKVAKVGIGWAIITAAGISGFILSKKSVDYRRYENMQARDRMRKSNYGEYSESERKF